VTTIIKLFLYGFIAYGLFLLGSYHITHYGEMCYYRGWDDGTAYQKNVCYTAHKDLLWKQLDDETKYEMWHTARRVK